MRCNEYENSPNFRNRHSKISESSIDLNFYVIVSIRKTPFHSTNRQAKFTRFLNTLIGAATRSSQGAFGSKP